MSQIPGEGEIPVKESLDQQIATVCEHLFKRAHFLTAQANGVENPEEGKTFLTGRSPREICVPKFGTVVFIATEPHNIEVDKSNGEYFIKGGIYFKVFHLRRSGETTALPFSEGFPISRVVDLSVDKDGKPITDVLTYGEINTAIIDLNRGTYSSYVLPWEQDEEKEGALERLKNLQKLLS